jgi:hypothetical protein
LHEEACGRDRQRLDDRFTELEANQVKLREVLGKSHCFSASHFTDHPQTDVHQHNMVAMMTSLQRCLVKHLYGERESRFLSSVLNQLSELSGEQVPEIESWMFTTFDVEFGAEIGSGGL